MMISIGLRLQNLKTKVLLDKKEYFNLNFLNQSLLFLHIYKNNKHMLPQSFFLLIYKNNKHMLPQSFFLHIYKNNKHMFAHLAMHMFHHLATHMFHHLATHMFPQKVDWVYMFRHLLKKMQDHLWDMKHIVQNLTKKHITQQHLNLQYLINTKLIPKVIKRQNQGIQIIMIHHHMHLQVPIQNK